MARRVRFAIAQPVTICGFYVASFLLIALVAVASSYHFREPGVKDQALTQAFYYANFAAGLYFIIATLMCITVYGAYAGHYNNEFKLTISQRTLMLQTISFMFYLLLGALIYSKIEGWKFLDALYWADFTCLTIGIGDFAPATHLGRSLLFPYAIGGIVILGLVVGSIRSLVLDRGKKKMSARMTEKTRKAVLRRIKTQEDQTGQTTVTHKRKFGLGGTTTFSLHPVESDSKHGSDAHRTGMSSTEQLERQRRRSEFHAMRYVQNLAAIERKWFSLLISGSAWFILWFVGALVFCQAEQTQHWSYFSGLYFAYTSLLTIGYGDLRLYSNSTKASFVFWSLLAVPTLTVLISNMGDTIVKAIKEITLYLGELTFLPSDEEDLSYWDRVSYGISKLSGGYIDLSTKHVKPHDPAKKTLFQITAREDREPQPEVDQPGVPHMEPSEPAGEESRPARDEETLKLSSQSSSHEPETTSSTSSESSLPYPVSSDDRPHLASPTSHSHFLLLLIREIKTVYRHLNAAPPKSYTYEDWERFLHLIGEDEADAGFHRAPPIPAKSQRAAKSTGSHNGGVEVSEETRSAQQQTEDEEAEGGGTVATAEDTGEEKEKHAWSWMGDRSPLMGEKDEAEWVMERLMGVLEQELRGLHRRKEGSSG